MENSKEVSSEKSRLFLSPFSLSAFFILILIIIFILFSYLASLNNKQSVYQINVKNKEVKEGATEIISQQGDKITFVIISDTSSTFKVMGYPSQVYVNANTPTRFTLTTDRPGHFDYGFSEQNLYFGSLNVSPKM